MDFTIIPASWAPRLLSILRIMTALLFLEHSTAKLFKFPALKMFANLDLMSLIGVAGVILFCFIFLYIAAAGPGPWSIDASRSK
jgi:putative oxidoreductase